jgi:hypothetical protein
MTDSWSLTPNDSKCSSWTVWGLWCPTSEGRSSGATGIGPVDTIVHLAQDGRISGATPSPSWTTAPFGQAEFTPRLSAIVDAAGRFAAAWTDEMRVVYNHDSLLTAWTAPCARVSLEPEQHRVITEILEWEVRQTAGPTIRPVVPRLKPCLSELLGFDATGTLWVLMYGRSRTLPEGEQRFADRLPPEINPYLWEEVERIGRFGPDGHFLGWVDLGDDEHFLEGRGDRLWVVNEESNAGSVIREYRIE